MFESGEDHLLVIAKPELTSDHEEADSRMILHANHASRSGYQHIIIRSPDTDIFVIALHAASLIVGSIYFLTGSCKNKRIIPVTRPFNNNSVKSFVQL